MGTDRYLAVFGDTTRKSEAERQKAIWETASTNQVYYGNYISALIREKTNYNDPHEIAILDAASEEGALGSGQCPLPLCVSSVDVGTER